MRKLEILFPALTLLFVVVVVGAGVLHYDYSYTVMRFPYLVGGVLVVLAGWQLVDAIREHPATDKTTAAADHDPHRDEQISTRTLATTGLWLLGILFAVQLLGYLAGIPLYLLAYFRAHGESWRMAVALSLGALLVTYFVFILFLKVRLPVLPLGFG